MRYQIVWASRRVVTSPSSRILARCCDRADWPRPTIDASEPTVASPCSTNRHRTSNRFSLPSLESAAANVAAILQTLGNEKRLLVLCRLVEQGEATVGSLASIVGLGQSALSQHLAKMREEGLVTTRRDAQTIWYRIADPRIERLLETLHDLYCRGSKI